MLFCGFLLLTLRMCELIFKDLRIFFTLNASSVDSFLNLWSTIKYLGLRLFLKANNFVKNANAKLSAPPDTATIKLLFIFKEF